MITANELRIGNWVYYGQSIRPITAIKESPSRKCVGVDNMLTDFAVIQPIPLTPEILEKAGFRKKANEYTYDTETFNLILTHEKEDWFYWNHSGLMIDPSFKYVHQLQNLYFALTGEELDIAL